MFSCLVVSPIKNLSSLDFYYNNFDCNNSYKYNDDISEAVEDLECIELKKFDSFQKLMHEYFNKDSFIQNFDVQISDNVFIDIFFDSNQKKEINDINTLTMTLKKDCEHFVFGKAIIFKYKKNIKSTDKSDSNNLPAEFSNMDDDQKEKINKLMNSTINDKDKCELINIQFKDLYKPIADHYLVYGLLYVDKKFIKKLYVNNTYIYQNSKKYNFEFNKNFYVSYQFFNDIIIFKKQHDNIPDNTIGYFIDITDDIIKSDLIDKKELYI